MIERLNNVHPDSYIIKTATKNYSMPAVIFEGLYHLAVENGWDSSAATSTSNGMHWGTNNSGSRYLFPDQRWYFEQEPLLKWKKALEKSKSQLGFVDAKDSLTKSKFEYFQNSGHQIKIENDMLNAMIKGELDHDDRKVIFNGLVNCASDMAADNTLPVQSKDIFVIGNAEFGSNGFIQFSEGKRRAAFVNEKLQITKEHLDRFLKILSQPELQIIQIRMFVQLKGHHKKVERSRIEQESIDDTLETIEYPGGTAFVFPIL